MDVRVELNLDLPGNGARRAIGALRGAVEAGRFAEGAVQRRRGDASATIAAMIKNQISSVLPFLFWATALFTS